MDLTDGDSQTLTAFSGSPDGAGDPDLGPDGLPGTDDDDFMEVPVDWSADPAIGSVSPASGSSTVFTPRSRPGPSRR